LLRVQDRECIRPAGRGEHRKRILEIVEEGVDQIYFVVDEENRIYLCVGTFHAPPGKPAGLSSSAPPFVKDGTDALAGVTMVEQVWHAACCAKRSDEHDGGVRNGLSRRHTGNPERPFRSRNTRCPIDHPQRDRCALHPRTTGVACDLLYRAGGPVSRPEATTVERASHGPRQRHVVEPLRPPGMVMLVRWARAGEWW